MYLPVNEQKEREEEIKLVDGGPVLGILIVDDNPKILRLLEKSFSRLMFLLLPAWILKRREKY